MSKYDKLIDGVASAGSAVTRILLLLGALIGVSVAALVVWLI